jgi:hypothetical protein
MKKFVFASLLLLILCSCSSTSFNKETWSNEPEKRNGILQSLVKQHELKGMTEADIIDLLSEPAQKLDEPSRQFIYYLGRAGFGVDDSLLRLYFNEEGMVKRYEVTHD